MLKTVIGGSWTSRSKRILVATRDSCAKWHNVADRTTMGNCRTLYRAQRILTIAWIRDSSQDGLKRPQPPASADRQGCRRRQAAEFPGDLPLHRLPLLVESAFSITFMARNAARLRQPTSPREERGLLFPIPSRLNTLRQILLVFDASICCCRKMSA